MKLMDKNPCLLRSDNLSFRTLMGHRPIFKFIPEWVVSSAGRAVDF